MCDNCRLVYEGIPKEVLDAMTAVKPQYEACETIAIAHMEELFTTIVIDRNTGEQIEMPEELKDKYAAFKSKANPIMAMAYCLGWFIAQKADSTEETFKLINPAQELFSRGLEEGNATRNTLKGGHNGNQTNSGFRVH